MGEGRGGRVREQDEDKEEEDQSFHDLGGGLQYQDEQYLVKQARPVQLLEEPLYMNQRREVGEADLWGRDPPSSFHMGVGNSWTRSQDNEADNLRKGLEVRGFLDGDNNSHNTSTETAGMTTSGRNSSKTSTATSGSSLSMTSYGGGSDLGACGGVPCNP